MMYTVVLKDASYSKYSHHKDISYWYVGMSFEVESRFVETINGEIAPVILIDDIPCPSVWWDITNASMDTSMLNKSRLTKEEKDSLDKYINYLKKPASKCENKTIELGEFSIKNNRLLDEYNNSYIFRSSTLKLFFHHKKQASVSKYVLTKLGYTIEKVGIPGLEEVTYIKHPITEVSTPITNNMVNLLGDSIFSSSFISELNKLNLSIIGKLLEAGAYWNHPMYMRNFTLIDNNKKIRFLPDNKKDIESNYQEMKIGKVFSKLDMKPTPTTIEKFVNSVLSLDISNLNFKELKGADIKKYYHVNMHDSTTSTGSLGASCMRHDECNNYFDIYIKNPDVCSMLVLLNKEGKVQGRAILWLTDCGTKVMDRIYGVDSTISKFKSWADKNDYHYKYRQSYEDYTHWNYKDKTNFVKYFNISLDVDHRKYPYIDTFYYIYGGVISNRKIKDRVLLKSARSTKGDGIEKLVWVKHHITKDKILKQEAVKLTTNGEYVSINEIHNDVFTGYIDFKDNFKVNSGISGGYVHNDNIVELDGKPYHKEDTIKLENKIYPKELLRKCSISGKWALKENIIYDCYGRFYFDKTKYEYVKFRYGGIKHIRKINVKKFEEWKGISISERIEK